MPSAENSIALQIDTIERRYRKTAPKDRRLSGAISGEDFELLLATLRREMATNEQLRASIDHLCARIEEVHDELVISRRRPS